MSSSADDKKRMLAQAWAIQTAPDSTKRAEYEATFSGGMEVIRTAVEQEIAAWLRTREFKMTPLGPTVQDYAAVQLADAISSGAYRKDAKHG